LAVPKLASGILIGKRGANIKKIIDSSGARVQLAQMEDMMMYPELQERVVTITGTMDQQLECVRLIFEKMQERLEAKTYVDSSTRYAAKAVQGYQSMLPVGVHPPQSGVPGFRPYGGIPPQLQPRIQLMAPNRSPTMRPQPDMGRHPSARHAAALPPPTMAPRAPPIPVLSPGGPQRQSRSVSPGSLVQVLPVPSQQTTAKLTVPDAMVGALLGHQGQSIAAMQQYSQATIRISKHPQMLDGTSRRMITLTGASQACETAQMLIQHKLSTASPPFQWQ